MSINHGISQNQSLSSKNKTMRPVECISSEPSHGYLYLILKPKIIEAKTNVTVFAKIMAQSILKIP